MRALYDGLARLEKEMHQHVHEENNVLFPKTLAMTRAEATAAGAATVMRPGTELCLREDAERLFWEVGAQ